MKLADHRVLRRKKALAPLEPYLVDWHRYITRYCAEVEDDSPWEHGERALVSTFTAVVAHRGALVLGEFSEPKKKKGRQHKGWGDLWFRLPSPKTASEIGKARDYAVEAKTRWPNLPVRRRDIRDWARILGGKCWDALQEAVTEVRQHKRAYGATQLGLAFIIPQIASSGDLVEQVSFLVETVPEWAEADLAAWAFPLIDRPRQFENRLLPGVLLLVRTAPPRKPRPRKS